MSVDFEYWNEYQNNSFDPETLTPSGFGTEDYTPAGYGPDDPTPAGYGPDDYPSMSDM